MQRNRLAQIAAIGFLFALFIALRITKISDSCLWFDEMFSVHAASQPWGSILSFISVDLIHPPFFYLLLKLWITVGGDGALWLRILPMLLSMFAAVPLILLLRELKQSVNVIALVVCLYAVSGSILKYSLEVRMYSLMLCLSLTSIWVFIRFVRSGNARFALFAVNILLIYTHYFGWFIIASQVVAIALFERRRIRSMLAIAGTALMMFMPWAIAVWSAAATGSGLSQNIGWMSRPGVREITVFVLNLFEPIYFQMGSDEPVSKLLITIPLILAFSFVVILVLVNWNRRNVEDRRWIGIISVFVAIPLLGAFLVSWALPYSVWGTRHLIIVFVPFYLLVGILVSNLPGRVIKVWFLGIGALLLAGAGAVHLVRVEPKYTWCEVGPLSAERAGSVPIYAVEDLIAYHVWFEHRKQPAPASVTVLVGIDGIAEDKAYFLPRGFYDIRRVNIAEIQDQRLMLVHRAKTLKETEPPLRNLIVRGYRVVDRQITNASGEDIGTFLLER